MREPPHSELTRVMHIQKEMYAKPEIPLKGEFSTVVIMLRHCKCALKSLTVPAESRSINV